MDLEAMARECAIDVVENLYRLSSVTQGKATPVDRQNASMPFLLSFARTYAAARLREAGSVQPEHEDFMGKAWPGHWPLTMSDTYQSMYGDDMGEGVWGDACAEFQDLLRAMADEEESNDGQD